MTQKLLEDIAKVTNLEAVKIQFCHLLFHLSFFLRQAYRLNARSALDETPTNSCEIVLASAF